MALAAAQALAAALLLALGIQALLVVAFTLVVERRLRQRQRWPAEPESGWPVAEVVLCLRGADPTLPAVLMALARQRYPGEWRLQLVLDSRQDPAWPLAEALVARLEAGAAPARWLQARIAPLASSPRRGSRKCAALHQAFGALDPATELVALVDADAVVADDWLAALARACWRPGIGAVSGNRWYVPAAGRLTGRVRACWNAAALVLMTLLGIAWGGSLAVRRQVIDAGPWRALLRSSLCEDTALARPLRQLGWRYEFRPELLAVDRDAGPALAPLGRWIARQLLTARLHHPGWPLVALHGAGTSLLLLAALVLLALAAALGQAAASALLAAALLAYGLGCVLLLLAIEAVAARALVPLGQAGDRRPAPRRAWDWCRGIPLSIAVHGLATWRAWRGRRVEWRGVVYRVLASPAQGGPAVEAIEPVAGQP